MKSQDSSIQVEYLPLDLSNLESVRTAAERVIQDEEKVDILVCNAGVVIQELCFSENRIEMDFQINYLGLFPKGYTDSRTLLFESIVASGYKSI